MDNLPELERQAWRGTLDYSGFHACEFKFLATIEQLGNRCRRDNIPAELLRGDVEKARKIYRREREELQYGLDINSKYQDAIRRSDRLRIAVEKAATIEDKLRFALECVELLTNETEFAVRNLRKAGLKKVKGGMIDDKTTT